MGVWERLMQCIIIPGLVFHMSSKIKNMRINELYVNLFKVGMINYIAQYGPYTWLKPFVKLHGAFSNYVEMMEVLYINECTGEFQIIPVTMFLGTLYNACWMFQSKIDSNKLIFVLDTFDLGDAVEYEKFMKTLSESTYLRRIPNRNSSFKKILVNTRILLNIALSVLYELNRCNIVVYFWPGTHYIKLLHSNKKVDYEDRGGKHDFFAHIMHSWVGFELCWVLLAFGLSPKLQDDLNDFSPDLFILFPYFGEKQRDSSKKEDAEWLLQILFNKTEQSSYFGKLPFGKKTKFLKMENTTIPLVILTWLQQLEEHFY